MINSAGVNFGRPNEEFIIESDGNGAITSARNAVTGDEYVGGGGGFSQYGKTLTITNGYNSNLSVTYMLAGESGELDTIKFQNQSITTSVPVKAFTSLALYDDNQIVFTIPRTDLAFANEVNCEVVATRYAGDNTNSNIIVTITDTTADASFTINKA